MRNYTQSNTKPLDLTLREMIEAFFRENEYVAENERMRNLRIAIRKELNANRLPRQKQHARHTPARKMQKTSTREAVRKQGKA